MKTVLVVAGIFVREGKLLLSRRPWRGAHPGLWEFPGGKVEPDETPEEALAREWKEELDVRAGAAVPFLFSSEKETTGERRIVILFFKVRSLLGTPRALAVEDVRWCGVPEARILPMPPADVPVRDALAAGGRFEDTEDPFWNARALEEEPYIPGSEALAEPIKFRKTGRPEGILLATPAGVRAYENVCPHVPVPLDHSGETVLSRDGATLVCRSHGALFLPENGLCIAGPCRGEALEPIPIEASGDGWAVAGSWKSRPRR